ncbi:MAG: hypothetical protein WCI18_07045, partial [Pseudomonadota bacterium]
KVRKPLSNGGTIFGRELLRISQQIRHILCLYAIILAALDRQVKFKSCAYSNSNLNCNGSLVHSSTYRLLHKIVPIDRDQLLSTSYLICAFF